MVICMTSRNSTKKIKVGNTFDTKNDIDIYKIIAKNAEEKYFNKFITLICTFISRFKVNNYYR